LSRERTSSCDAYYAPRAVGYRRYGLMRTVARQHAAQVRRQAVEARHQAVAYKHLQAEALRHQMRTQRIAHQDYVAAREQEAEDQNLELVERLHELEGTLAAALHLTWPLDFATLKRPVELPQFNPQGADLPAPEPLWQQWAPKPLGAMAKLIPGSQERHRVASEARRQQFDQTVDQWRSYEAQRQAWLALARVAHEQACERLRREIGQQHKDVDAFENAYRARDASAVTEYFTGVLEQDQLPDGYPTASRVAYVSESRQLVVERDLPGPDLVPAERTFRYVKSKDSIEGSPRPAAQLKAVYTSMVAQLALRTLHSLFAADVAGVVDTVVLNCVLDTVNPATGKPERPCLLTVRTSRDVFSEHDLSRVDPAACLKHLSAEVSRNPFEVHPVRPIVDFNMVDPRFVDKPDVLSGLESRPNLADLSPSEFEALITNLFEKMGLETRLTQASRDGGVDCVAWDMRPIVGGKVVVQAKRYKHTVGVSAVRDLFGTVHNEGAAKGILVSTSGYGKSAYEFVANKPLELITGGQLLYLLEQQVGLKARIDFPEDWEDPPGLWEQGPPVAPQGAPVPEAEPAVSS
jgi:restriction system protein